MAGQQQKVSVFLTGSVDEQQVDELKGPMLQQGASPNLDDSRNTRLSLKRGTCVRAPDVTPIGATLTAGAPAFGIVGNNRKRRYALYTTPDQQNRVVAEDGYDAVGSGRLYDKRGTFSQNGYMPWQVSGAGQIPGVSSGYDSAGTINNDGIAVSYNPTLDQVWYAWLEREQVSDGLVCMVVCVTDAAGTLLAQPKIIIPATFWTIPESSRLGLTAHGANGTRLWFQGTPTFGTTPTRGHYMATVQVVSNRAQLVTATRVGTDGVNTGYTHFSVCAQDAQYAYLAGQDVGPDCATFKIDVTSGATAAKATMTGGAIGATEHAFAGTYCRLIDGAYHIASVFSRDGNVSTAVYNASLAPILAVETTAATGYGPVAAKFLLMPQTGIKSAVFAYSSLTGTTEHLTNLWARPLPGSSYGSLERPYYWQRLCNQGAQWDVSPTECYPVFFFSRNYHGLVSEGGAVELLDPSIVGYVVSDAISGAIIATPIARFGCVRGALAPAAVDTFLFGISADSVAICGKELIIPYRKDDSYSTGRYIKLSTEPEQPGSVHDRDGVAIVAAALPVQWDGAETVEYGGPLHAPILLLAHSSDPNDPKPPSGQIGFCAIFEWVDGAGMLHRSMPSVTQSLAFNGSDRVSVKVLSSDTMRDGIYQDSVSAVLYMTGGNGTAYMRRVISYFCTSPTDPREPWPYYETGVELLGEDTPIIYSRGLLGEELVPQPPPPLRDIAIVGSRCWGIDAEIPTRIVYSKHRVAGIGFEFFPAGEVIVPSNAGDVIALREQAGALIVFAERAIFQVSDGGPNNMGSGSFGAPYKISELGTRHRSAVVSTPQGIMFLDNAGRFSVLRGGAVAQLPGANVLTDVRGAFVLEDAEEVVFPLATEAKVFNYALSRWTNWDLPAPPTLVAQSAVTRDAGVMYAPSTGRTYTVLSSVLSATSLMSWETDWFLLGGDFQDYNVMYDVIFNAYNDSPHGIRIELLTEYDGVTATTSRDWSAAELTALSGATGRYTVRVEPVRQDARGIKVKIRELTNPAPHVGCRPGTVTIVYSVDGMTYEESNIPGSHK